MEPKTGKLYIVATPIGNLGDMTMRAVETLSKVELILCEDTRVTKRLLDHYQIQKPLLSYHQRSRTSRTKEIIDHLSQGNVLALVTDAGTPGISDPGNELVAAIQEHFGHGVEIIPIPGVSALTCLAQVSGINLSRFAFFGFPPNKKGRETFFRQAISVGYPVIYYDSPHRFEKNLELIRTLLDGKTIRVVVGRELTKMFEEVKKGPLEEVIDYYRSNPDKVRGEFVVILY